MSEKKILLLLFFLVLSLNSLCVFRYVKGVSTTSGVEPRINTGYLQTGDIVLRRGKGIVSSWFARMSQHDPRFSHAGIVLKEGEKVRIVSCTQDAEKPGIISESADEFLSQSITQNYAVFRLAINASEREMLAAIMKEDIVHPTVFDSNFELGNDSAYYCTEYVYLRMNQVAPGILSHVSKSAEWSYIAPEDLYLYSKGRFIYQNVTSR